MHYKAVKERDGTYTIRESRAGLNYQVLLSSVRGCNVTRTLNRLAAESFYKEREAEHARSEPARAGLAAK
jgi:hypothetical protein